MPTRAPPTPPVRRSAAATLPAPLAALAGFLMGAADAVPGVSGGTIALVLGIYERLVDSLSAAVRFPLLLRDAAGRSRLGAALRFLVPLLAGLAAAYWLGTRLLVGPRDDPGWLRRPETAPLCYAFFFGLVLVSLREPWRRIPRRSASHVAAATLAALAAFVFVGLPPMRGEPPTWALLYGGALAVAVMLLPGVSGSLLLVVLGQYAVVAGALHDRELGTLGVFLAGVLVGVGAFVPLLRALLRRAHDVTMAALTGLMAGSLRALWPWKTNYDPRRGPLHATEVGSDVPWVLLALGVGAAAAWALARLERRMRTAASPAPR